jgi:predicted transglutaminase-like cysteine proteinase
MAGYCSAKNTFRVAASLMTLCVSIALAAPLMSLTVPPAKAQGANDEPFGFRTAAVTDGPLWVTWQKLQLQFQAESRIIAQCRAAPESCRSPAASRFIKIAGLGDDFDTTVRIKHINRAINLTIRGPGAGANNSTWNSPLTTLASGTGDCKQYAVLKYAVLRDAGFGTENVRILIVRIKQQQSDHAMVAIRDRGTWLVLDNRSLAVLESREFLERYLPLYSLDHRGVRRFILPSGAAGRAPPCDSAG